MTPPLTPAVPNDPAASDASAQLARQDVCFCGGGLFSRGCDGGQITTPWEYIKRTGAVTGGQFKGSGPFGKGALDDYRDT